MASRGYYTQNRRSTFQYLAINEAQRSISIQLRKARSKLNSARNCDTYSPESQRNHLHLLPYISVFVDF